MAAESGRKKAPICVPPVRFTATKIFVVSNQHSKSLSGNWVDLRLFWESHYFETEWSIACLYMPFPLLLHSSDPCGVHGSSKVNYWELILSQASVCKRVGSICQPLGLVEIEDPMPISPQDPWYAWDSGRSQRRKIWNHSLPNLTAA